jgi:hypothetical protein
MTFFEAYFEFSKNKNAKKNKKKTHKNKDLLKNNEKKHAQNQYF